MDGLISTCCDYGCCWQIEGACTFYEEEPLSSGRAGPTGTLKSRLFLNHSGEIKSISIVYKNVALTIRVVAYQVASTRPKNNAATVGRDERKTGSTIRLPTMRG